MPKYADRQVLRDMLASEGGVIAAHRKGLLELGDMPDDSVRLFVHDFGVCFDMHRLGDGRLPADMQAQWDENLHRAAASVMEELAGPGDEAHHERSRSMLAEWDDVRAGR